MAPWDRCCSQHAYISDCAVLSLSKDPQCCCGALVSKVYGARDWVHDQASWPDDVHSNDTLGHIVCHNHGGRQWSSLQAPSVCIGCRLAFCTRHVIPGISPMTTPLR
jgi:hypothetical protein